MVDSIIHNEPETYQQLLQRSEALGFSMPSDILIGTLLKTLVASKPRGRFLELGTGMGLSLAWMLDGMDINSTLISVDNDQELINIVQSYMRMIIGLFCNVWMVRSGLKITKGKLLI